MNISPSSILPIFLDIHNYANELINIDNVEIKGRVKLIRKRNLTIVSIICFIEWVCTSMQNCTARSGTSNMEMNRYYNTHIDLFC